MYSTYLLLLEHAILMYILFLYVWINSCFEEKIEENNWLYESKWKRVQGITNNLHIVVDVINNHD